MNDTINTTLSQVESYSYHETVIAMYKLTETLKEEIENLKSRRNIQTHNTYNTEVEKTYFAQHYDSCIFEVEQIIRLIKQQYPELYKIDGEMF